MRWWIGGVLAMSVTSSGVAGAGERFPTLKPEAMTAAQRQTAQAIASGPRKSLGGPFNAWLRSPELADRLQKVGEYLRFHSSVPPRLNEFAILITARAWNAEYEWYAHYPLALRAGLAPQVAADLAAGRRPATMSPDEAVVFDVLTELRRDKRLSDARFAEAKALLGEQGLIDLIALAGYYDTVSMTLNLAQVKPPEPGPLPLPVR
ncbi:carboxymuconolactone decarboxylase family protein [Phenylobacterium sp.]|uniref:carboxymuconolactone decarboxylase family protein n=1 Tax=Phenylobacterium sp. TaxID=1871053 RepID=UPI002DEA0D4E|nr:carboxymuconolactone decarboxylase family protein [Phenylobacterium sp.]